MTEALGITLHSQKRGWTRVPEVYRSYENLV